MKRKILGIFICGILLMGITGCNNEDTKNDEKQPEKEQFMIGNTLDDGRIIHFSFDVPYISEHSSARYLSEAFTNNLITIDEVLDKLDNIDILKDGGSKIYEYNKDKKIFGKDKFYVITCNSLDNIKDIYVAKYKESLDDKCNLKIDDLDGVSMTIKDGTLTNIGATIIIKDVSNRNNIYGESYKLEKENNGVWTDLKPKNDMTFTSIGYSINEANTLELKANWEYHYGKLENGRYRILKDTSESGEGVKHYITTEFVIK